MMISIPNIDVLHDRLKSYFLEFDYGSAYPLPRVAAAYELTIDQREQIESMAKDVAEYLRELLPKIQGDHEYICQSVLGSSFVEEQRQLFRLASLTPNPFLARIDCVWDGSCFKICEMNVDAVGGVEDAYFLRKVYDDHYPHLKDRGNLPIAGKRVSEYLRQEVTGRGLVVYTDGVCRNAGGRLAKLFQLEGIEAEAIHINDIPIKLDGISWIWRHLLLTDLFDSSNTDMPPTEDAVARFFNICLQQEVTIVSPIRDRLLFDKRFLVEQFALKYGVNKGWDRVSKWIPKTKIVTLSDYQGLSCVPERTVLKPVHGFGGVGVVFPGDPLPTPEQWESNVWVQQELINGEKIEVFGGETPEYRTVHGIHLLDGEFIGDHIRLGTGWLARGSGGYIPAY